MWALSAMNRTVGALPRLHPWRLDDVKGAVRTMLWVAESGAPQPPAGLCVLTQTAPDPELEVGGDERPESLVFPDAFPTSYQTSNPRPVKVSKWVGAMTRLPGTWLPPLAILPTALRGFDDPGTRWSTESIDFAARHTVHTDNTRFAADVLAPHVMALILDVVPHDCAITISGDAVHVWQPYSQQAEESDGLAVRLLIATDRLCEAIPSFVLVDFPDRSNLVEDDLSAKSEAAEAYRSQRTLGRSQDPTLQRIYDQAHAAWEASNVSSQL